MRYAITDIPNCPHCAERHEIAIDLWTADTYRSFLVVCPTTLKTINLLVAALDAKPKRDRPPEGCVVADGI